MLNVSGERQGPFPLLISPALPATPSESLPREPGRPLARSRLDRGIQFWARFWRTLNTGMCLEEGNREGTVTEACPVL